MGKNWKTTSIGILLILGTLCGVGVQLLRGEAVDFQAVIAAVVSGLAGLGLIVAKDFNVTGAAKMLIPAILIPLLAFGGLTGCATMTQAERLEMLVAVQASVVQTMQAAYDIYAANETLRAQLGESEFQRQLLERQARMEENRVYLEFLQGLLAKHKLGQAT